MIGWRRCALATAVAVALASAGALALRGGRPSTGDPLAGAATSPVTPVGLKSSCPVRITAEPVALDIAGFAYCPANVTVAAGVEVRWTNVDLAPHTVTY